MDYFPFPVGLSRHVLRPFTFSNGVTVPAGTEIAVPTSAIHTDGDIYPNPEEFDGFRFAKLRGGDGVSGLQATSTSAEYLIFGYGRHAWCVFFRLELSMCSTHCNYLYSSISALVASSRLTKSRRYLHIYL